MWVPTSTGIRQNKHFKKKINFCGDEYTVFLFFSFYNRGVENLQSKNAGSLKFLPYI